MREVYSRYMSANDQAKYRMSTTDTCALTCRTSLQTCKALDAHLLGLGDASQVLCPAQMQQVSPRWTP